MVHPIFVCVEHGLTFHTCAVAGGHARKHGGGSYLHMLDRGVFAEIGQCTAYHCEANRVLPASPKQVEEAKRLIAFKREKATNGQ